MFIRIRQWCWKRKAKRGIQFIEELDTMIKRARFSRPERKRFWREFVEKAKFRQQLCRDLKEIRFGKKFDLTKDHDKQ